VDVPLYEYRCAACEHEFETLVAAGRADQTTCPECGADQVRRLLSLFSAPRGGEAAAWSASGAALGGDGASVPTGCCGGGCGSC
jgi:putative FmdB family regulatory protein